MFFVPESTTNTFPRASWAMPNGVICADVALPPSPHAGGIAQRV
jgi:hypothetical protein